GSSGVKELSNRLNQALSALAPEAPRAEIKTLRGHGDPGKLPTAVDPRAIAQLGIISPIGGLLEGDLLNFRRGSGPAPIHRGDIGIDREILQRRSPAGETANPL